MRPQLLVQRLPLLLERMQQILSQAEEKWKQQQAEADDADEEVEVGVVGSCWEEAYYSLVSLEKILRVLAMPTYQLLGCAEAASNAPGQPNSAAAVRGVAGGEVSGPAPRAGRDGEGGEGEEGAGGSASESAEDDEGGAAAVDSKALLRPVVALLLHPHAWIRLAAARLLGLYFSHREPSSLVPREGSGEYLEEVRTV